MESPLNMVSVNIVEEEKDKNLGSYNSNFNSRLLYWSYVVNCRSCSAAHKGLSVLKVVLQVISIALIAIVAATKQGMLSAAARSTLVSMAVLCFVASRWLRHFIYKDFHFHDYNHALR